MYSHLFRLFYSSVGLYFITVVCFLGWLDVGHWVCFISLLCSSQLDDTALKQTRNGRGILGDLVSG